MTESSGGEVLVFKYRRGRQEVRKKICLHAASFSLFLPTPPSFSFYGSQDGGHGHCTSELLSQGPHSHILNDGGGGGSEGFFWV